MLKSELDRRLAPRITAVALRDALKVGCSDCITPQMFGAVGDGDPANANADTAGVQSAIDAWLGSEARVIGGVRHPGLLMLAGHYVINANLIAKPIGNTIGGHLVGEGGSLTFSTPGGKLTIRSAVSSLDGYNADWRRPHLFRGLDIIDGSVELISCNDTNASLYDATVHPFSITTTEDMNQPALLVAGVYESRFYSPSIRWPSTQSDGVSIRVQDSATGGTASSNDLFSPNIRGGFKGIEVLDFHIGVMRVRGGTVLNTRHFGIHMKDLAALIDGVHVENTNLERTTNPSNIAIFVECAGRIVNNDIVSRTGGYTKYGVKAFASGRGMLVTGNYFTSDVSGNKTCLFDGDVGGSASVVTDTTDYDSTSAMSGRIRSF